QRCTVLPPTFSPSPCASSRPFPKDFVRFIGGPRRACTCGVRRACEGYWIVFMTTTREGTMRLKDKVAIVTGGAQGMAEAEARLFAAEGAKVVVADILEHEAQIVAADIRAGGEEAMAAKIDVTSESEWVGLIA